MTEPGRDDQGPVSAEDGTQPASVSPHAGLRALTQMLNERTPPLTLALEATGSTPLARYPEMPLLPYFRETWAALRLDGQMRRSLQYVPENAGPLNSRSLVHRALSLMQGTSPGYLQHLLAYIDELGSLSSVVASTQGDNAPSPPPSTGPARKSTKHGTTKPAAKNTAGTVRRTGLR